MSISRPTLARLLFSFVAVGILAYVVNWGQFYDTVRHARGGLILLAYSLYVLDRFQMSYKWGLLLRAQALRVPFLENWSIYSLASLWATILPATVGADALRAVWLWRRTGCGAVGTASIVLERLVGFVVGLSVAAISVLYLISRHQESTELRDLLMTVVVVLGLTLVGTGLSFSGVFRGWLAAFFQKKSDSRVGRLLVRVGDAYLAYRATPGVLMVFTLLTVVEQLTSLLMGYLIALAVGVHVGALEFVAALSVALLVSRLPIAVDGIGVLEGILVLLLAMAGIPPAQTVAFALIGRIMNVLGFAPGAAVALFVLDLRPRDLRTEINQNLPAG
ncbi:MAG: lysylphosphatidylglycerol synthase transmembrane domain-containing protein [Gammaproteobacteria bacterium]|nr:lysylphosphatidylglycerol synthase transmembrane domain-containing protein [Gammaproteobacteria bacterium]